ncbi:MAG: WecB/TagA/CpsF family glycosyltransferase [Gammaproteobacteria bacterium]|nr:WecB/TagA/CpsF family glycosyltransferase [Gammaproteobacteria bacterium]NNF60104.1 WecB/TagA/CpsF family glycosyltransferase [Gammaproteobacteria bacterium]
MPGVVDTDKHPVDFGPQFRVLNTDCTATSYSQLADDLATHCRREERHTLLVDFTNVHIVAMRSKDEQFREITDTMDLFVPDSMVLTWAVNWKGGSMRDRVYGPSFLTHMITNSPPDLRHYFLGASQECLDLLLAQIRKRNPDFLIAGSHHGYFGTDDEDAVLADINAAQPDLVWVGLGTPKQQEWIYRVRDRARAGALLAVGFAFDVNAGTKKDAPPWMQRMGLTWFYRLLQEPRRLWWRYLYYNSVFLWGLLRQKS